jgi:hypothetical protein
MGTSTRGDRRRPKRRAVSGQPGRSVLAQVHRLAEMTVAELGMEHQRLYGQPTRSRDKQQLFRKLAGRVQELEYGERSDRALRRAEEITDDLDWVPTRPPRTRNPEYPSPGVVLTREYRGEVHWVTVLERGFEYNGQLYRSLSGIARGITGTNWNGKLFFGIVSRPKKNGGAR